MTHEGRPISREPAPAQIPAIPSGDAGAPPALPLEVAGHPLPPVDARGAMPQMAEVPAQLNFSEPGLIERFDRLVEFAFTPPAAPRTAPAEPGPAAPPPPREQPIEEARLAATLTFCQQLVGNHAAIQHYLNPGAELDVIGRTMALDTERRVLVIDSLVDIVRFGRRGDEAAAANIVDQIQRLAITYLDNTATEEQRNTADRILPRLVQRVMECDAAGNNNPLWLRLVAVANLFGRPMREQPPSPINAQALYQSAGTDTLPSDHAFRAALGLYNPADPASSPLAKVVGREPAAADPKGNFRKIAYAPPRTMWQIMGYVDAVVAEYPDALYTISNQNRAIFTPFDKDSLQRLLRDRHILSDPEAAAHTISQVFTCISSNRDRQTSLDIWALLKSHLNHLMNHPNPEIRETTIYHVEQLALGEAFNPTFDEVDQEVANEARALLPVGKQILITGKRFFECSHEEETTARAALAACYIAGAPGFVVGGALGLVGGAIVGFFKGLAKGQNPLKTAAFTAKAAAVDGTFYGSFFLGGFIGAQLVSTPAVTALYSGGPCTFYLGLPGSFTGGLIAGIGGGLVGFFAGLFTGHNPLKYATHWYFSGSGIGSLIGTYLFGGFIGLGLDFLIKKAMH